MKTFQVEIFWTQTATLTLQAESEEEAKKIAEVMKLPAGEYLQDSFTFGEVRPAKFSELRDFPGMNGLPFQEKE
jgi:hypothetical protein